ncbi:MAG TPA: DNA repair protein RadC [Desulfotomaculum sp.]|nr:DNA repair protein RadC [Desulfotomaculum sp.]
MKYGVENVELPGLIASLIGAVPDETINALIGKGIRELAGMSVQELAGLPGMGRLKATRLAAAFEIARRLAASLPEELPVIRSPEDAAGVVMKEMRYLDREHFFALLLNTKNRVIARELISIGTLNSSTVHPRELFKSAIRRSAAAVILVHNHPSGDPEPSRQDQDVTRRLQEAGQIVGIEVLDHIIIGDGKFVSFKARGLI